MALHTERPNETVENPDDAWVKTGGGYLALHTVVNDDSDATYIQNEVAGVKADWVRMRVTNLAMPDGSRLLQYRARARMSANSSNDISGRIRFDPHGFTAEGTHEHSPSSNEAFTLRAPDIIGFRTGWTKPVHIIRPPAMGMNESTWDAKTTGGEGKVNIYEAYADFDVRARPTLSAIELFKVDFLPPPDPPLYTAVACGSTITDVSIVAFKAFSTYGYSGVPTTSYQRHQQARIFSMDQVAMDGFQPWINGIWGPPVRELKTIGTGNSKGVTQLATLGQGNHAMFLPLPNDSYKLFFRIGTGDFISMDGNVWWSLPNEVCTFTIDAPVPLSPTATTTVESCPPSVAIAVTHIPPSGGSPVWTDPAKARVQVQVSWNDGPFVNVYSSNNSRRIDESDTLTVTDRFVHLSTTVSSACSSPITVTNTAVYRVRLYGKVGDAPGAFMFTDWTTLDPITVPRCDDPATCLTYLIHPEDSDLDWYGSEGDQTYTTTRPYAAGQPVDGGLPVVVTGYPGGRNWALRLVARGTQDLVALETTLSAPVLWFIPDDPILPNAWVVAGPDTNVIPDKIATPEGPLWELTVPATETGPPVQFMVGLDLTVPDEDEDEE